MKTRTEVSETSTQKCTDGCEYWIQNKLSMYERCSLYLHDKNFDVKGLKIMHEVIHVPCTA
jgi:hypothetical protein